MDIVWYEIHEAQVVTLSEIYVQGPETGGEQSVRFGHNIRTSNTYSIEFSKAVKCLIE